MKTVLNRIIKKMPLYPTMSAMSEQRTVRNWENSGKPSPPPHVVKQQAIREFANRFGTTILVETGTYHGDMVEAMRGVFSKIYSIELSPELYRRACQRFAGVDAVTIIQGDSGSELGKLIPKLDLPALFWLDGHYSAGETAKGDKDTPIFEELQHIFSSKHKDHVILIDDARCFGSDPAYPSIDTLKQFIEANASGSIVEVANDCIRVSPPGRVA